MAGCIESTAALSGRRYGGISVWTQFCALTMMNVLYPSRELVCTVSPDESGEALSILARRLAYLAETVPGLTVVVKTVDNETELTKLAPYIGNYPRRKPELFFISATEEMYASCEESGGISGEIIAPRLYDKWQ